MREYEAPEFLEIGKALHLTLGQGGHRDDNCLCHIPNDEDSVA
jgi:hypothetical protein